MLLLKKFISMYNGNFMTKRVFLNFKLRQNFEKNPDSTLGKTTVFLWGKFRSIYEELLIIRLNLLAVGLKE